MTEGAARVFFYRIQGEKEGVDFDHQKKLKPFGLRFQLGPKKSGLPISLYFLIVYP